MRFLPTTRHFMAGALFLNLLLAANASAQSCPVSGTFNGSIGIGDPSQDGRIARVNPPSDCGGPKPYPGTVDNVPRRFDQYNFTNSSSAPACIRVTINPSGCGGNEIFSAAYLGSFNPADVSQNYLGDSGDTPPGQTLSYSFNVPAGANFVVVVHEINAGAGCAAYTLSLDCGTPGAGAGQVLISEFRLSGPGPLMLGDPRDEFIDLYNNTDAPILVGGYSIRAHDPAFGDFEFPIPPGTTIPARGHLLIGDSAGYSLPSYATLDIDTVNFFDGDVFIDNEGFQLIGPPGNNVVVDSVGFVGGGNAAQYVEGTGLTRRSSTPAVQYSYVRKMCDFVQGVGCTTPGTPKDTNNNAADFLLVSVTAENFAEAGPMMLGAPGPENRASPRVRNATIPLVLLDPTKPASSEPNRVRTFTPVPNGPLGTLNIQRRVVNNTGGLVTRLRFRVVEITTLNGPGYTNPGQADIRVLDSTGVVTRDDGTVAATTLATTVEEPPVQPNGGGYNTTITVGKVTSSTPIPPGGTLDISIRCGIVRGGLFRILVNVEALP
ncbi:MAG: lamin tail domain-containing protein [Acidobacteriota bacterium]|nr:lamin tail domain-containing protein [Acidobacteriota bacterium]